MKEIFFNLSKYVNEIDKYSSLDFLDICSNLRSNFLEVEIHYNIINSELLSKSNKKRISSEIIKFKIKIKRSSYANFNGKFYLDIDNYSKIFLNENQNKNDLEELYDNLKFICGKKLLKFVEISFTTRKLPDIKINKNQVGAKYIFTSNQYFYCRLYHEIIQNVVGKNDKSELRNKSYWKNEESSKKARKSKRATTGWEYIYKTRYMLDENLRIVPAYKKGIKTIYNKVQLMKQILEDRRLTLLLGKLEETLNDIE